ncbi:unnamed protein product [Ascophyllum nodosum]
MDGRELDLAGTVGYTEGPLRVSYNSRDLLIYALGIGCCGRDDGQPGDADMRYLYEGHPNFSAFPTYALALPFKGTSSDLVPFPGPTMTLLPTVLRDRVDPGAVLHYDQSFEIQHSLDPRGAELEMWSEVVGFYQRRGGVLLRTRNVFTDRSGRVYCKATSGGFIRGLKISSDAGPPLSSRPMPARPVSVPDATASVTVSREQALLYRLSGDYNAIHADLEAARSAGLDGPILHGLCSLGIAARQVLRCFCESDPSRLKSLYCRFSRPVRPGDELEVRMWRRVYNEMEGGAPPGVKGCYQNARDDQETARRRAASHDSRGAMSSEVFQVRFAVFPKTIGSPSVVLDGSALVTHRGEEFSRSRL